MRVVIAEFMAAEGLELLARGAQTRYDPGLGDDPPALAAALAGADGLIVRNRARVDARLLHAAPRLRAVGRLGSGLDNLDLPRLAAAGIEVVSAPGVNAGATAEFALCLALALARRLEPAWLGPRGPDFSGRAAYAGLELGGRTLGVVGLGRVGQALARKARALGMTALAAQPRREAADGTAREVGAELVPLPELLRRSDVLSLHTPLTAETRGLVGRRELALLRPTAVLINTARGGLIDEAALALALRERWLAGAALDVRDPEPPAQPDPLDGVPNLIRTPHVAGLTQEAQREASLVVAAGLLRVLRREEGRRGHAAAGAVRA